MKNIILNLMLLAFIMVGATILIAKIAAYKDDEIVEEDEQYI